MNPTRARERGLTSTVTFPRGNLAPEGSVIKSTDYDEDRITGKVCASYDPGRSAYFGKKDGFDYRNVFYTMRPTTSTGR